MLRDKDGARVLRKYRLPSTRASAYTALGYGLPRAVVADENAAGLFEMNLDEWAWSDPPALYTVLGLSLFSDFVPYLGVASTGSEWTTLPEFTTCTVLELGGWPGESPIITRSTAIKGGSGDSIWRPTTSRSKVIAGGTELMTVPPCLKCQITT